MNHPHFLLNASLLWLTSACSDAEVGTPVDRDPGSAGGAGAGSVVAPHAGSGGAHAGGNTSSSGGGGAHQAGASSGAGGAPIVAGSTAGGAGSSAGANPAGGASAVSCPPSFDANNPAEQAMSRSEAWWPGLHEGQKNRAAQHRVAFVGDSLTQFWTEKAVSQGGSCPQESGETAWTERFAAAPRSAGNWGIGGDRTEHILWRIQDGGLDAQQPVLDAVVLMAGTNNVFGGHSAAQIAAGVGAIIHELRCRFMGLKVVLVSIPPLTDPGNNTKVMAVNVELAKLADGQSVRFVDVFASLTASNMRCDGIHLSAAAYEVMATAIDPALTAALAE